MSVLLPDGVLSPILSPIRLSVLYDATTLQARRRPVTHPSVCIVSRCRIAGPTASMLRSLVLIRLALAGHKETVDECMRRFDQHYSGAATLEPDLRAPVGPDTSIL